MSEHLGLLGWKFKVSRYGDNNVDGRHMHERMQVLQCQDGAKRHLR